MLHILSSEQFTDKNWLKQLFDRATQLQSMHQRGNKLPSSLSGKVAAALFYEPSTRTRLSFEAAVLRLGGRVISAENARDSLSTVKGESFADTIRVISSYADAIVLRHPEEGAAAKAADYSAVPVINAGDGGNEHPTQALLDVYTIQQKLGRLQDLHLAFGFDPLHSRTIRSLALVLSQYPGNRMTFISPPSLRLKREILEKIKANGASVQETDSLAEGLAADILYLNRLQEERFSDRKEFERHRRELVLTADKLAGRKVLVMDPLPRTDEIDPAVDKLPNAIYFAQAKNGLYVRMALLEKVLRDGR